MRKTLRLCLSALIAVAVVFAAIVATAHIQGTMLDDEVSMSADVATTSTAEPSTSTTSTTVATTTTTIDVAAIYEYAAALDRATSTTTTVYVPPPTTVYVAPPTTEYIPPPTTVYVPQAEPQGSSGLPAFLVCVRQRESGGNYGAVNPSSGAGGAFQFLPSTWAAGGFAARYGVSRAEYAAPWQQDEAAISLYAGGAGASHWAGPGCG